MTDFQIELPKPLKKRRLNDINPRLVITREDVDAARRALKKSVIKMVWIKTCDLPVIEARLKDPEVTEDYVLIPLPDIVMPNGLDLYVMTYRQFADRTVERIKHRLKQEPHVV